MIGLDTQQRLPGKTAGKRSLERDSVSSDKMAKKPKYCGTIYEAMLAPISPVTTLPIKTAPMAAILNSSRSADREQLESLHSTELLIRLTGQFLYPVEPVQPVELLRHLKRISGSKVLVCLLLNSSIASLLTLKS